MANEQSNNCPRPARNWSIGGEKNPIKNVSGVSCEVGIYGQRGMQVQLWGMLEVKMIKDIIFSKKYYSADHLSVMIINCQ